MFFYLIPGCFSGLTLTVLELLEFEKIIGIWKPTGKVRKSMNVPH